jgi:hypothetical protein
MVKNTIGGKKGKMLAKKRVSANDVNFPVSMNENEIYVCVIKIFGGGVFQVVDNQKNVYKAFLRGKMKGSNKRHNLVSMFSILLGGIRIDSSDKSLMDILFVYETHHIQTISLIPSLDIKYILQLQFNSGIISSSNSGYGYGMGGEDSDNIFLSYDDSKIEKRENGNMNMNGEKEMEMEMDTEKEIDFNMI